MKTIKYFFIFFFLLSATSCSHRYYTSKLFKQQTQNHHVVAVLPAEMIFTGVQPKNLSADQIEKIEETESLNFQQALYNSILQYANTGKYFTTVNIQDIGATLSSLEDSKISVRESWKEDDKVLCKALNVDAVVRMRVRKQRFMSDAASYGVDVAKQIVFNAGLGGKVPMPRVLNKTNDIYASCSLLSNNYALWNDSYKTSITYNNDATEVIENIADDFGRNFPYKKSYREQRREDRGK